MASTKRRPPAGRDGEREVLDLEGYIPFFLSAISNKWSSTSSRLYLELFGVGITEWRAVAMLAIEPRITANRICEVIGLDKAATSRSVKSLLAGGYLTETEDPSDNRRQILELTARGYDLHDRIMAVALERERLLLEDLAPGEITQLANFMQRMLARVPDVREFRPERKGRIRRDGRTGAGKAASSKVARTAPAAGKQR